MKNILMVMYEASPEKGGITRVMMNRTFLFNKLGYRSSIVTFDEMGSAAELEFFFKEQGRIHPESRIVNFLDFYKNLNSSSFSDTTDNELDVYEKGYFIQDDYLKNKGFVRYFDSYGVLIKQKNFIKDNLVSVYYYDKNRASFIKNYLNDKLFNIVDYQEGVAVQTRFFTSDGFCFYQKSSLGENQLPHYFLFDRKSKRVQGFNSYKKMHAHFLEQLCTEKNYKENVIICDGQGSTGKVVAVSNKKALRLLTVHSNHYLKPFNIGAELRDDAKCILADTVFADGVIVLTNQQKQDLAIENSEISNKFFVIPNTVNIQHDINKLIVNKAKKTINIVSRYVVNKQLDHIVLAIYKLFTENQIDKNNLQLNFYGAGNYKDKLIVLVEKLGLQDIVNVHGYAMDVSSILAVADITILASVSEGFGMAVIEAMMNKTPVISYDINYGPRDIITDGQDGFLVKANDIDALSKKIYDVLFENYNLLPSISENAFNKVKSQFSHEHAAELWKDLLENKLN